MNGRQRQRAPSPPRSGFGRRFLIALLTGADDALQSSRRDADEQAAEEDLCRVWPAHSRLTRGYEEP